MKPQSKREALMKTFADERHWVCMKPQTLKWYKNQCNRAKRRIPVELEEEIKLPPGKKKKTIPVWYRWFSDYFGRVTTWRIWRRYRTVDEAKRAISVLSRNNKNFEYKL